MESTPFKWFTNINKFISILGSYIAGQIDAGCSKLCSPALKIEVNPYMHSIKYYKYKGDVSEHKDNIFVQNDKDWFIFCDQDQKLVTAKLIKDHLEKMTGWKNFVEYNPTEPELDAISEGIARVVLHVGYDYA